MLAFVRLSESIFGSKIKNSVIVIRIVKGAEDDYEYEKQPTGTCRNKSLYLTIAHTIVSMGTMFRSVEAEKFTFEVLLETVFIETCTNEGLMTNKWLPQSTSPGCNLFIKDLIAFIFCHYNDHYQQTTTHILLPIITHLINGTPNYGNGCQERTVLFSKREWRKYSVSNLGHLVEQRFPKATLWNGNHDRMEIQAVL